MSSTISTSGKPPDIDGLMATDAESLRQRIRSAIRFRLGEWFLAPLEGLDYDLIIGHIGDTGRAASVLLDVINAEGAGEIEAITDVTHGFDPSTRRFRFSCLVDTVYGDSIEINETIPDA